MVDLRAIRTDADLAWAIAEIAPYLEDLPLPASAEAERFDVQADLIEAYDNRTSPVGAPEPVDLIRAHRDTTGHTPADLGRLFGSRSRASEVLNRRRGLTVEMIRRLDRKWGVPAAALVEPYRLAVA